MDWGTYFVSLSSFAGVVFALTLVARHLPNERLQEEGLERNETRKWDSISVTYELAAGALLAILYLVHDSWIAGVFGSLVAGLGVWLYLKYLLAFWGLWHHKPVADIPEGDRPLGAEKIFFFVSIVPLTSLVAGAAILWMRVPVEASEWFAAACTWLVFSGTMQAILWYLSSWEPPRSSQRA